jgi:hypothetical protein
MNTFLALVSNEVALGSSIVQMHDHFKGVFTSYNWQVVSEDKSNDQLTVLYLIPPSTETIGNSQVRETMKLTFSGTQITFVSALQALQPYPQVIAVRSKTGGTASNSITVGGSTVSQDAGTLNAGNTAEDNLYFLYLALLASSDSTIMDWNWTFDPVPQPAAREQAAYIFGVRKTAASNQTFSANANCYALPIGDYAAAGMQSTVTTPDNQAVVLPVDLVNGFAYMIQMQTRCFAWITKTVLATNGPVVAAWGDHAEAVAMMPSGPAFWSKFLSPCELLYGITDGNTALPNTTILPAKTHFLSDLPAGPWNANAGGSAGSYCPSATHPFGGFVARGVFLDARNCAAAQYVTCPQLLTLAGSGIHPSASLAGQLSYVHALKMPGNYLSENSLNGYGYTTIYGPSPGGTFAVGRIKDLGLYKFLGTANNEVRILAGDPEAMTTLNQAMDATSAYGTIQVGSTTPLQSSGVVTIGTEAFSYTGKTSSTLTGCTRRYNNTRGRAHLAGDEVRQGVWFVKFNGAALYAGFTKPS